MKYSTEEKILLSTNRPDIEIENIEFSYSVDREGDESPADEICYFTENGYDAFTNGEHSEGIYVTFTFKDKGVCQCSS